MYSMYMKKMQICLSDEDRKKLDDFAKKQGLPSAVAGIRLLISVCDQVKLQTKTLILS